MVGVNKVIYYSIIIMSTALLFSACSTNKEVRVHKKEKDLSYKTSQTKKYIDAKPVVKALSSPLQRCEKKKNMFNLIVDAPLGARVRIMNIKPKYKDCIALKKGKYLIEVYQHGYEKYKRWMRLESSKIIYVDLKKVSINHKRLKLQQDKQKRELESAGYDLKKLQRFVKRYPKSLMAHTAKKRINRIKSLFKNYSPHSLLKYNGCVGFYPKNLVEKLLNIETSVDLWSSIRWSGTCRNGLMYGRGLLYFDSDKGLHVELKGKMQNGFFQGRVYNSSNSSIKPSYIKGSGNGYYRVELNSKYDFIKYQR